MAQFVNDTFTEASDTTLASHTPDGGGSWTRHSVSSTNGQVIGAEDRFQGGSTSATSTYYHSGTPAGAEYDIQATIRCTANDSSAHMGALARVNTGATTYYQVYYVGALPGFIFEEVIAGSITTLGTYNVSLSLNTDYTLKLEIRDAAKKFFLDGVERLSSSNNNVTAAGKAGVRSRQNGRVDNFTADDAGGGGVSVDPGNAAASGAVVAPTVILGSVSVSPAAASAAGAVVAPTVRQGSLSIDAGVAAAVGAVVAPTVRQGSLSIDAGGAAAVGAVVAPTVALGSLAIAPAPAAAAGAIVAPTVDGGGGLNVTPAGSADAAGAVVAPVVILGSVSITPAAAAARSAVFGPTVDAGGEAPAFIIARPGLLVDVGRLMNP